MPRIKRTGYNWSQAPIWMTCDHDLSDGGARLFCYLDWRAGDGSAFPALATIARDLGKSEDSVRRHLRELEALGYVTTIGRPGRSSIYTVHHDVRTDRTPQVPDQPQNCDPLQICNPTPRKNATPPPANLPPITREPNEKKEPEMTMPAPKGTTAVAASSELNPQTLEERVLFGLLQEAASAKGRRGPGKFANPQQARDFRAAAQQLNGQTTGILQAFMRGGGDSLGRAVAYVVGAAKRAEAEAAERAKLNAPGQYVDVDIFFTGGN